MDASSCPSKLQNIPMHWGTFPALEQSTENFALELAKRSPHTKLKVLTPGTPTLLF